MSTLIPNLFYLLNFRVVLRLVASANSPTIVELIVELIRELFIGELLNYNFLDFQKACFN